jgi:hypothetical protein
MAKIRKIAHRDNIEELALDGALDAALEIARRRRDTLAHLRGALEAGNQELALAFAKELCGLTHDQTSHRTDPRVN